MAAPERVRELERNAQLRRVDWRFLLQQRQVPASICLASAPLARALALVSTPIAHGHSNADLVVLVNPRRRSVEAAWNALRPGGELYLEWYVPVLGRTRLPGLLAAAGFADVRCYWPWPWPSRAPSFWLPLDRPNAIDFFLRSRQNTPPSWLRTAVRVLWHASRRFGLLVPLCVIARKPNGPSVELEVIQERWEQWGFGRTPERLTWLLLTGGRRAVNKPVALVFGDCEQAPRLAVKFARSEAEEEPLRREAAALHTLQTARPDLGGVPKPLFVGRRSGQFCLGETAADGSPLMLTLNRNTYAELAARTTQWLVELAGRTRPQPQALWWNRLVEDPLREFETNFEGVIGKSDQARTRELLASLGDLPLVFEHRDFSPWNVLVGTGGELRVLDWESSEREGLPAFDLVYFLTYASFLVDDALASHRTRKAYARTRDPRTATGAIVDNCERSYCEHVGLDRRLLAPLRLLCWIVHSRSEYRRLELDAAGHPDREALRSSLFLRLWEEELRHNR